jgi:hypothetical protein
VISNYFLLLEAVCGGIAASNPMFDGLRTLVLTRASVK